MIKATGILVAYHLWVNDMKTKVKSTILLFLTAIIWGFAFVAQAEGAEHLGAFTFNGIRFILGACSLIPVVLIFDRKSKITDKKGALIASLLAGTALFLASNLQQKGVELTESAGLSGFLTGLYIVLVPLIRFVMGKKTSVFTFVGALFALAGLFFLCIKEDKLSFGKGEIMLILCALVFALHILIVDKYVKDLSPLKFSMFQFFVCGVLSLICAVIFEDISFIAVKSAGVPILYCGIMSVGVAYTCQVIGQKDADPTFASIVFSTESVFSAVGGAILLNEIMSSRGYFGCVLIFIGIVLSQLNKDVFRKKQKSLKIQK